MEGNTIPSAMAFGFPASYTVRRDLFGNRQTGREAVIYALDLLRWEYEALDIDRFRARIRMGGASWGEQVYITLGEGEIEVRSVCSFPQIFDWGKNKHNVEEFFGHFAAKEFREVIARKTSLTT
jgi:hypothetical protein